MYAAFNGHLNVLRVLLAVPGIDLNKRATGGGYKGKTALGIAMTRGDWHSDEMWARKQEYAVLLRAAVCAFDLIYSWVPSAIT